MLYLTGGAYIRIIGVQNLQQYEVAVPFVKIWTVNFVRESG